MTLAPRLLLVSLAGLLVGCSARVPPPVVVAPPPLTLPVTPATTIGGPQVTLKPDPIGVIIARAEREFVAGQSELEQGRLAAARLHFDAAIDILIKLPDGARAEPRISAEFTRLLDRITALDLLALREGDGFTETRTEPAAIDELLGAAVFERPRPALTTEETVIADLARQPRDIEIPVNDRVLSFVELFQGRLHDFMEAGLQRSQRYMPMIQAVFKEEGLPLDLAFVPLVESAFKNTALSRVSARGMWQFMAATGQEHGLDQTWFVDERSDPEKATRAAAQYLKSLHKFFDGDWNFALASYNAGPGRVQRAVRQSKAGDYWQLTSTSRYLPRETRDYVPMIMAAIIIARNPSLYGFEIGAGEPLAYETVTVPNALDLRHIAEWADVSVEQLRELNPELRRTTTPMGEHPVKVPVGTAATVQTRLATATPLFVQFQFHTVRRGETLATIARRYKITQTDLRSANDLGRTAKVKVNQSLRIPERAASGMPAPTTSRAVTTTTAKVAAPVTYRVQRGDTLFSIARRFDTSVDEIKKLNQLRTDRIAIGDRLHVPR